MHAVEQGANGLSKFHFLGVKERVLVFAIQTRLDRDELKDSLAIRLGHAASSHAKQPCEAAMLCSSGSVSDRLM
jgi:hypothetical protein